MEERKVKQQFTSYTENYNPKDPKIALKIAHTYRVAELCKKIAESLELSHEECEVAWLSGMLHDIGRFEQVKRYNTFIDGDSVDHAAFGADLLFGPDRLANLFYEEREFDELLETVIRAHNQFRIPVDLDEKTKVFCHILRDADKIDILRVNIETPMEDIYNTTKEKMVQEPVSEEVMRQVRMHQTVTRDARITSVDHLIGHMALTFELVYPYSRKIALEQGFLQKLFAFPTENAVTKAAIMETKQEILSVLEG